MAEEKLILAVKFLNLTFKGNHYQNTKDVHNNGSARRHFCNSQQQAFERRALKVNVLDWKCSLFIVGITDLTPQSHIKEL